MIIRLITDYLETWAPLHIAESYDNVGLLTGQHSQTITGILVSLDCTEDIVQEAIERGCNMVIAHHPIVFKGLKKVNGYTYVERAIIHAIKNDIAIYALHTNLDNIISGVNKKIAETLGMINCRILLPKIALNETIGSGIIGDLPTKMDPSQFLSFLKLKMQLQVIKHSALINKSISKIALCGGAGSFLIPAAISEQVDIFITADLKYHEFFDADQKMILADIGHYESEKYTIDLIKEKLATQFQNINLMKTEIDTNPVQYFI